MLYYIRLKTINLFLKQDECGFTVNLKNAIYGKKEEMEYILNNNILCQCEPVIIIPENEAMLIHENLDIGRRPESSESI